MRNDYASPLFADYQIKRERAEATSVEVRYVMNRIGSPETSVLRRRVLKSRLGRLSVKETRAWTETNKAHMMYVDDLAEKKRGRDDDHG